MTQHWLDDTAIWFILTYLIGTESEAPHATLDQDKPSRLGAPSRGRQAAANARLGTRARAPHLRQRRGADGLISEFAENLVDGPAQVLRA
jgi:hypothetical protein